MLISICSNYIPDLGRSKIIDTSLLQRSHFFETSQSGLGQVGAALSISSAGDSRWMSTGICLIEIPPYYIDTLIDTISSIFSKRSDQFIYFYFILFLLALVACSSQHTEGSYVVCA
jgi:hypothetical protein